MKQQWSGDATKKKERQGETQFTTKTEVTPPPTLAY